MHVFASIERSANKAQASFPSRAAVAAAPCWRQEVFVLQAFDHPLALPHWEQFFPVRWLCNRLVNFHSSGNLQRWIRCLKTQPQDHVNN